jgi:hypothetical protein
MVNTTEDKDVPFMGVKFNREYQDIIADFSNAISTIPDCHELFEMSNQEWNQLSDDERHEIVRTLADDLFYGLGNDRQLSIGSGLAEYDPKSHVIKVTSSPQVVHLVRLI